MQHLWDLHERFICHLQRLGRTSKRLGHTENVLLRLEQNLKRKWKVKLKTKGTSARRSEVAVWTFTVVADCTGQVVIESVGRETGQQNGA